MTPGAVDDLTVGEVAEQSGMSVSAIHFYESKGLISARRTAGNRRRYSVDMVKRLLMIQTAQKAGISLDVIRRMLVMLPDVEAATTEDWMALLHRWLSELEGRIARLARLREEISYCRGCGCLSVEACPLVAPEEKPGKGPIKLSSK